MSLSIELLEFAQVDIRKTNEKVGTAEKAAQSIAEPKSQSNKPS